MQAVSVESDCTVCEDPACDCASNLYRSFTTVLQVLSVRGFDTVCWYDPEAQAVSVDTPSPTVLADRLGIDLQDWTVQLDPKLYAKCRERLVLSAKGPGKSALIVWYPSNKFGVADAKKVEGVAVKALYSDADEPDRQCTLILVHKCDKLSCEAVKHLNKLSIEHSLWVDVFHDYKLYTNILLHPLVPRHKLLSQAKKERLLSSYSVQENRGEYAGMALIPVSDPVISLLGGREGDVVKVWIKSNTFPGCCSITYRYIN